MEASEAKKLKINDTVIWDNETDDRGTIIKISAVGFFVRWDNDGQEGWIDFQDAKRINLYNEIK